MLFSIFVLLFTPSSVLALGDDLIVAAAYDAKALDPAVTIDAPSILVGIHIHENLLCIDENSKLIP